MLPINLEWSKTLWAEYVWLAPFVLYAFYLLRYFLVRKPLQTGVYNHLVVDLLDPVGREAAIKKIGAPNRWSNFYRDSLDGLLAFFDRVFGEEWLDSRALHVCYLVALVYPLFFILFAWFFKGEGWIGVLEIFPSDVGLIGRLWRGGVTRPPRRLSNQWY
ncbi:MAG: hypothetical protein BECKG1743D_GA0114223_111291 [Candidatus Kentron sp. G]|nr:MAG: hypothetical protein BECKG1743D_GA0114223_111291 [Candidatus Kentron sp. G]